MGKRSTHNRYLLMRNSQLIMMQPPTKPNDNCMPPIPSIHLKFDNTILDSILSFFLSPSLRHDMCNSVLDDCPPVFPHLLPIVPISGSMHICFLTLIHILMCIARSATGPACDEREIDLTHSSIEFSLVGPGAL